METIKEVLFPLLKAILFLSGIGLIGTLIWGTYGYFSNRYFWKRVRVGTAVRLEMDDEKVDGWYVVKARDGDQCELIRLAPDNTKKKITDIPTDLTVNVETLKPF